MLTGGQVIDCTAGAALLQHLPACDVLRGDKGYDANAIRRQIEERGALANITPKRMFCRLKDFRRVATRYDRNTVNFLAAVCFAATVSATGYESRACQKVPSIGRLLNPRFVTRHHSILRGGLLNRENAARPRARR